MSTDYKNSSKLEIGNLLDKNVLDFFKIIATKCQRNVYYVNNGIMYKTNCNEVEEKSQCKIKKMKAFYVANIYGCVFR